MLNCTWNLYFLTRIPRNPTSEVQVPTRETVNLSPEVHFLTKETHFLTVEMHFPTEETVNLTEETHFLTEEMHFPGRNLRVPGRVLPVQCPEMGHVAAPLLLMGDSPLGRGTFVARSVPSKYSQARSGARSGHDSAP